MAPVMKIEIDPARRLPVPVAAPVAHGLSGEDGRPADLLDIPTRTPRLTADASPEISRPMTFC